MAQDATWSFTTQPEPTCPCSLWDVATATPTNPDFYEGVSVELGVRFRTSVDGFITGIRFYKGAGNTGLHTGTLWSADGVPLATGTFENETTTGWQTLTFASPVPVVKGVTYVASYFNPAGSYAVDAAYFLASYERWPLQAVTTTSVGAGVFSSSSAGGFPTNSYNGSNYWVDVVFTPTLTPTP
jgi:hypothetical protein